jgi:polyhydroxyalkanoate synthase
MADDKTDQSNPFADMMAMQDQALRRFFSVVAPGMDAKIPEPVDWPEWAEAAQRMQELWLALQQESASQESSSFPLPDPAKWSAMAEHWYRSIPLAEPDAQRRLWQDGVALWESVLGRYGIPSPLGEIGGGQPHLPHSDRRFADPRWKEQPFFALIHQTYLMMVEQVTAMVEAVDGIDEDQREQLRFATKTVVDAMSPALFPLTNPVVLDRIIETKGKSLVKGMEHLLVDLKRGQLTHTDPNAFKLGENIAATPGKVVHETQLYQLIQYSPTTDKVLEVPLVIFPPWINRFYILDLSPQKSFVRWAVEQGLTVFMVSWKSADQTMADISWDDYIRAQIDAIDTVRERLGCKAVHAIGYCVAGTTLAATLAVLARRGQAEKVKSTTFFTAQVDFEKAGELKLFTQDAQLKAIAQLGESGFLDGRYMAATFNLLRGNDLIWSSVVKHYLLGEDYPAFDLLHWNGDTTNLPARWHRNYLRDLYHDNRLVVPDQLSADGTPIDLTRIETPAYVQAGRDDHIAPADSVHRITRHLRGPLRFVLAGSGHIAGVVNPPSSGKYQYWINDKPTPDIETFIDGAVEHPGSWWPDWIDWIRQQDSATVPAKGKRKPGGRNDPAIEDAPGRYVKMR